MDLSKTLAISTVILNLEPAIVVYYFVQASFGISFTIPVAGNFQHIP